MVEMKLKKITFARVPALPGIRAGDLSSLDCDNPGVLKDWRLVLRGPSVFLISPAGWGPSENRGTKRDPKGPVTMYEIPRVDVFLQWAAGDEADIEAVLKGGRYDSEPLGWKPTPVESDKPILSQIPASQLGDA
jgi:hypothetical protein